MLQNAVYVVLAAFFAFLALGRLLGAIYHFTPSRQLRVMLKLARPRPGETFVDLGAGDGRVVVLAARLGLRAVGYEINPFFVLAGWLRLKALGLSGRGRMRLSDLWRADISDADVVFFYGMTHLMRRIEAKLRAELKPGARVISVDFTLPGWLPSGVVQDVYLYRMPRRPERPPARSRE